MGCNCPPDFSLPPLPFPQQWIAIWCGLRQYLVCNYNGCLDVFFNIPELHKFVDTDGGYKM